MKTTAAKLNLNFQLVNVHGDLLGEVEFKSQAETMAAAIAKATGQCCQAHVQGAYKFAYNVVGGEVRRVAL